MPARGGGGVDEHWLDARPTHDGWYAAVIPIGACQFSIGVQFGRLWDWVQLDAVHFLPEADIPTKFAGRPPRTTPAQPVYDGISDLGGMLRCDSAAGFMLVPPPPRVDDRSMVLAVVFRPLADRKGIAAPRLLAAE